MVGPPKGYWAKLHRDDSGNVTEWHPLLAHCAEVAAVTEALLDRTILRRRLARLAGWDDLNTVHVSRLAALAAIHDAGKVNHGFQNQAFDPHARRIGHVKPLIDVLEHEASSQERLLLPLGVDVMRSWFPSLHELGCFLLATWGHHGRPVQPTHDFWIRHWERDETRDPVAGLKEIGDHVRRWFPEAFQDDAAPFPSAPALQHAYNGLLTLADWIASDVRFFEFADSLDDPMPRARTKAHDVTERLFLDPANARATLREVPIGFSGVLEAKEWAPHPIQQACLDLPIYRNGSLTILESDTGSGKTETAIARFIRLYQEGVVDGMYFAVPTRSAATQLQRRVEAAVKRVFGAEHSPSVVLAVPGYIRADDREAIRRSPFEVEWPDDADGVMPDRGWAAQHPKRYLAGPIVVGTVDQALMSALQISHAHMRAAALLRHFLVVDEVHASDSYMSAHMDRVLQHHLSSGGHALLMSATLGSTSRFQLATGGSQPVPLLEDSADEAYPLLTHVDASRKAPETVHAASAGRTKTVKVETHGIAGDALSVAGMAVEAAGQGARVLVIRNTVADCVATQRAVEDIAGNDSSLLFGAHGVPAPHHSRYAQVDRRLLDDAIEDAFGKRSKRNGVVAVCTQTVEQSLDIDADRLITDLCPIDVLLQRIGRLHRHGGRSRPAGYEKARCVVLTPVNRDFTPFIGKDGESRGKHGLHDLIYYDLRIIEATLRLLESEPEWVIPRDNRRLVERATHPQILHEIVEELGQAWRQHDQRVTGRLLADRTHARYVGLRWDIPFGEELFAKDLGPVKSRLGEDSYLVKLPEPLQGPFGQQIQELSLSAWQVKGEPVEDLATIEQVWKNSFSFRFGGLIFMYDRYGVILDKTL